MSISNKLLAINQVKNDIKASIEGMGGDLTGKTFSQYPSEVSSLSTSFTINGTSDTTIQAADTLSANDIVVAKQIKQWQVGNPANWYGGSSASTGYCFGMACTPDGSRLVVACHRETSTIGTRVFYAYNWSEANQRYESIEPSVDVNVALASYDIALSEDGMTLAICGYAGVGLNTFKWSVANSRYEKTADPDISPADTCVAVELSPDGTQLAVGRSTAPFIYTYTWNAESNRFVKDANPDVSPSSYTYGMSFANTSPLRLLVGHAGTPYFINYQWSSANSRFEIMPYPDVMPNVDSNGCRTVSVTSDGNTAVLCAGGTSASAFLSSYKWNSTNGRYEKTAAPDIKTGAYGVWGNHISNDGLHVAIPRSTLGFFGYEWDNDNARFEKTDDANYIMPGTDGSLCVLMPKNLPSRVIVASHKYTSATCYFRHFNLSSGFTKTRAYKRLSSNITIDDRHVAIGYTEVGGAQLADVLVKRLWWKV